MANSEPSPLIWESTLAALHRRAGGHLTCIQGFSLVERYQDSAQEHRAVREAAGIIDQTHRGLLLIRGREAGADRVGAFAQRLFSNNALKLEPGAGQPSCLLTSKGKMVASFHLYRSAPGEFLLIFSEPRRKEVDAMLQRYAVLEEIEVLGLDGARGILSVQGPRAAELLKEAIGFGNPPSKPFTREPVFWSGVELSVRRAGETPDGGYEIEVPANSLESVWDALARGAALLGGGPVGQAACEILRIEAGIPRWGAEIDETRFPNECGLDRAIDYEKGCFIGQEVLARIRTYGHLNRRLLGVLFPEAREVAPGAKLFQGETEVGWITSAAVSPRTGGTVALAYLGKSAWDAGNSVELKGGGGTGEVVERPPVKKS